MKHEKMFFPEKKETDKNFLLQEPEKVSLEKEKKQEGELSFSFGSDTRRYYLGHKEGVPFFMVECFDALPDELSEEEKAKFSKEKRILKGEEKDVYVLKYGPVPKQKEEYQEPDPDQSKRYRIAQARDFERDMIERFIANDDNKQVMEKILTEHTDLSQEEIAQIVEQIFTAQRRGDRETIRTLSNRFPKKVAGKVRNEIKERMLPKPKELDIGQLIEILKNKRVLFYTGAGISVASGVHSMNQLYKTLGIDMSKRVDDLLRKAVSNPQGVIESWEEFTKAAFEKPATPAHQSLAVLAQKIKSQILTENVDHLQERTGIKAIHLTGPWLKENIRPEWLKDIDVVVAVGLSYDNRGFLGWYKENNQNGKIVAINLDQPSYLGDEDFLLKGDCQKIVSELEKEFDAKDQN